MPAEAEPGGKGLLAQCSRHSAAPRCMAHATLHRRPPLSISIDTHDRPKVYNRPHRPNTHTATAKRPSNILRPFDPWGLGAGCTELSVLYSQGITASLGGSWRERAFGSAARAVRRLFSRLFSWRLVARVDRHPAGVDACERGKKHHTVASDAPDKDAAKCVAVLFSTPLPSLSPLSSCRGSISLYSSLFLSLFLVLSLSLCLSVRPSVSFCLFFSTRTCARSVRRLALTVDGAVRVVEIRAVREQHHHHPDVQDNDVPGTPEQTRADEIRLDGIRLDEIRLDGIRSDEIRPN